MGRVTAGANLYHFYSSGLHSLENMLIHPGADALILMCGMDGI
jgi:hypothetical protein